MSIGDSSPPSKYHFPLPQNLSDEITENPFHYDLPDNIYNTVLNLFFHLSSIRFNSTLSMQRFSKLSNMFDFLYKNREKEISQKVCKLQRTDFDIIFKRLVQDGFSMDFGNFIFAFCLICEKYLYGMGGRKEWRKKHGSGNGVKVSHNLSGLGKEERRSVIISIYSERARCLTRNEMLEFVLFGFDEWKHQISNF